MKGFEEVYETLPGAGWLSKAEAELLWRWALKVEGPILEVGCFKGRSTVLLASTGRLVHTVDPFVGFALDDDPLGVVALRCFFENLNGRGIGVRFTDNGLIPALAPYVENQPVRCYPLRIEDWEARPVGFAYLDGDHTETGTEAQVRKALECGAKIIAVHDVNDTGDGLLIKRVCLKLLGVWAERAERLAVWERP